VQVDRIKPTLKAPEIELLKPECDYLRFNFAFKFNLRRYTLGPVSLRDWLSHASSSGGGGLWCLFDASQASLGEAVQVDPMNPTVKAPGTKRLKLEL
jgi:hypothetical protein